MLTAGHPRRLTLRMKWRLFLRVVSMSGKRLPDYTKLLEEGASDTERERYGMAMMIMFVPFRTLRHLLWPEDSGSWWKAFHRVSRRNPSMGQPFFTQDAIDVMKNMQSYFDPDSSFNGDPPERVAAATGEEGDSEDGDGDEEDNSSDEDGWDDENAGYEECDAALPPRPQAEETLPWWLEALQDNNTPIELVEAAPFSADLTTQIQHGADAALAVLIAKPAFTLQGAAQGLGEEPPPAAPAGGGDACEQVEVETSVLVDRIQQAATDLTIYANNDTANLIHGCPPRLPPNRPSISEASMYFTLNRQQHTAFVLIAAALLQSQLQRQGCEDDGTMGEDARAARDRLKAVLRDDGALRMFMCGCAGSGKSRVIHAAVDFARRWHMSDSIVVTASTGAAAAALGGFTYHSAMGIGVGGGRGPSHPSEDQLDAWQPVVMVFLDEVSMMGRVSLTRVNKRLQQLKEEHDDYFGGVHMVFSGDLFQLASMEGAVYVDPITKPDATAADFEGYRIWKHALNAVVELVDSKRHEGDTRFAELLHRYLPLFVCSPFNREHTQFILYHYQSSDQSDDEIRHPSVEPQSDFSQCETPPRHPSGSASEQGTSSCRQVLLREVPGEPPVAEHRHCAGAEQHSIVEDSRRPAHSSQRDQG